MNILFGAMLGATVTITAFAFVFALLYISFIAALYISFIAAVFNAEWFENETVFYVANAMIFLALFGASCGVGMALMNY